MMLLQGLVRTDRHLVAAVVVAGLAQVLILVCLSNFVFVNLSPPKSVPRLWLPPTNLTACFQCAGTREKMQIRALSSLLPLSFGLPKRSLAVAEDAASRLDTRTTVPAPIVIAASQDWDGNDGPWSSFPIQIGTPSQNVKVLISTSGHQTLAVIPEGCISTDPSNCETLRGGFFKPNESTTWQFNTANLTSYVYPLLIDENLGYLPKGELGFDDVTLGWQGSGGPTLDNQTVGGFEDKAFELGYFGISPRASNFTSFDNPIPSYVQNLKNKSLIPSISWSYTAGNQYRLNSVLGSLVFGGYDTSKFVPNDVTFPFGSQDIRDLSLQLEGITMSDNETTATSLLPTSINAMLDSSLPFIWLPVEACTLFETAFGLVWNDQAELYLLNSSHQATLMAQNANVTFTLGNLKAGENVNITLPYAAFNLEYMSPPIVNTSTPYFPLKRAANSTQYTLGRTFFQEAYVTADYENGNFSVSQCSWVPNSQQNIVAITSSSDSSSSSNSTSGSSGNSSSSSSSVSPGAIAGGVVGGVVVLAIIGLIWWFAYVKPRRRKAEAAAAAKVAESENPATPKPLIEDSTFHKAELDSSGAQRVEMEDPTKNQWVVETDGSVIRPKLEMDGKASVPPNIHEMDGKRYYLPAEADGREVEIHEMPAREEVAAEMTDNRESIEPRNEPRWSWAPNPGGDMVSPESRATEDLQTPPLTSPPESASSPQSWRARLARSPRSPG